MKYRSKSKIVEAMQLNENTLKEITDWIGDSYLGYNVECTPNEVNIELRIRTLEGVFIAKNSNYIVKGIKNEFYPVREDIFLESYEAVE